MPAEIAGRAAEQCLLVDPWNVFETSQVFLFTAELPDLVPSAEHLREAG